MKKAFPGDPEYSWDRFCQLPYEYVLTGFAKMQEMRMDELNELEMPVALNTAVYANSQRDPKSSKKPLGPLDFAMYKRLKNEGPSIYYASCYMAALKEGLLPTWALFCYKEIAPAATGTAGRLSVLVSEDAILVGPRQTDEGLKGLLIALESASAQVRTFKGPDGEVFSFKLPLIETKVIAREDVTLS